MFVGAFLALVLISGLGALVGRAALQRVSLGTIQRVAAVVCLVLAVVTALEAAGVELF